MMLPIAAIASVGDKRKQVTQNKGHNYELNR